MRYLSALLIAAVFFTSGWAGDVPRSARLVKDAGNQFLAAKKYADAIDCYFQALELCPEFSETHYNLGVAFLKGYNATRLALHHFEHYLALEPGAADRESVQALAAALRERVKPVPEKRGEVVAVVAGRLLVAGADWVKPGDRIEVSAQGEAPCAQLLADYVYPDGALTQRIWDESTLNQVRGGMLAVNASDRLYPRR